MTAREHRVPLCSRAVEVLQRARQLRADWTGAVPAGLLFSSRRVRVLRDQSLSGLMSTLGIAVVSHGFRSCLSGVTGDRQERWSTLDRW